MPLFKTKRNLIFTLLIFCASALSANNIHISNIKLTDQNVGISTIRVGFDLSWDNSWRVSSGPSNWDAAWVFVKYRTPGNAWQHMNINYVNGTNDGHTAPSGSTINTSSDQKGCFIYRSVDGAGNNNFAGVELLWDYSSTFLAQDATIDIKVFAIEMVYVPQGAFSVGNGAFSSEVNRFYQPQPFLSVPYPISSEGAITVGTATGNLYYSAQAGSSGGDQLGPIPATYPKGYDGFYCMKYEVSQGQYVAFFNTLTNAQKTERDLSNAQHKNSDEVVARNGFAWTSGNASTPFPDRALNYVSTIDAFAYLDWAGLRPMSELEFEKACRGTQSPVINEYAWGTAEIWDPVDPMVIINDGTPNALISNPSPEEPLVTYLPTASGFGGPMRCGIHAASAVNKNRTESGGTYYGIMEMSGNLYERTVSVGTPDGRAFTGLHGDGALTGSGLSNVANWPGVTTGGVGYRGGSYANQALYLRMADRFDAANVSNITNSRIGFRGVRTAE